MNQNNMSIEKPSKQEVADRIANLYSEVNKQSLGWEAVLLVDKVNHYYFTGTMQDGLFVLKNDGTYAYFVRRSFERAKEECLIDNVYQINSYKDIRTAIGDISSVLIETEVLTCAALERLKKHFTISNIGSADKAILKVRSVKSRYELACIEESGKQHKYLLESVVPSLLREGMSEAELTAAMYKEMIGLGFHGVARFAMFQTEIVVGQIGFSVNSLYPTCFDGPGGMRGMHPAAPIIGDRSTLLKKGDIVFVDNAYGVNGYHTDRTQIYMFGKNPPDELLNIHRQCKSIQTKAASLLKPGAIPSDIYNSVLEELDESFLQNFMGFGTRTVKFLGHGVGLQVDEFPIIANGFLEPLAKDMAIALEPKKGVAGVGIVGVEDTYVVTENGGRCITGGEKDIITV